MGAYVRYFVRHPTTQLMPRKVKTAFTATDEDRAITGIHDIAYILRIRDGVKGFELRVGGGTSIMPRVPDAARVRDRGRREYLKVAEAVFRVFDRQDWLRANRACAHQGVRRQVRIEELARQVDEELEGDGSPSVTSTRSRSCSSTTRRRAPRCPDLREPERRRQRVRALARDERAAAAPGRFSTVQIKVIRGDLTPEQFRGLAGIMRRYSGGYACTTVHQNLVLRWVRDETVYEVWQALSELGLGDTGADEINDVISCPGTDSCKLGITSSMGLNHAVRERVESMGIEDPLTRRIHIKMSGCPNGCSQHHIANIGFYGASIKVGEHTIPAYVAHIGGNYEGGEVVYGTRSRCASRRSAFPTPSSAGCGCTRPSEEGEEFNRFAERVGQTRFEDEVRDLSMPVEFSPEHAVLHGLAEEGALRGHPG